MDAIGADLAREITARAPKDAGDLSEAAHYRVSNDGLGVAVGYSKKAGFLKKWRQAGFVSLFQEFGTKHHPAQPFIRPIWRYNLPKVVDRIDAALKRFFDRLNAS
jgi:HK97 gp10 family phage protein